MGRGNGGFNESFSIRVRLPGGYPLRYPLAEVDTRYARNGEGPMKPSQILVRLAMEKLKDSMVRGDIHDRASSVLFAAYSRLEGHYTGESLHSVDSLLCQFHPAEEN